MDKDILRLKEEEEEEETRERTDNWSWILISNASIHRSVLNCSVKDRKKLTFLVSSSKRDIQMPAPVRERERRNPVDRNTHSSCNEFVNN